MAQYGLIVLRTMRPAASSVQWMFCGWYTLLPGSGRQTLNVVSAQQQKNPPSVGRWTWLQCGRSRRSFLSTEAGMSLMLRWAEDAVRTKLKLWADMQSSFGQLQSQLDHEKAASTIRLSHFVLVDWDFRSRCNVRSSERRVNP